LVVRRHAQGEPMIQRIAEGLAKTAAAVLVSWATTAQADAFAANVGNERVTLTCEGPAVVETSCSLGMGSSGVVQVRFTAQPTRYAHLLKRGMEKAFETGQHPPRPSDADISLLRGLALDQCHPAAESKDMSGDLLQLCIPPGSSSNVVLFMRGLCDRCEFEPLILKKQVMQ